MPCWRTARLTFWRKFMADLFGLRVINTRPLLRAQALETALRQAGAQVEALPLLETVPLPITDEQRQWLMDLDRYRWVFVVSPTAAELGLRHLEEFWPQWPLALDWLAVGESTARVLREALLQPIVPEEETSEGLLRLPVFNQLQSGDRMLVLRGEGGRNLVRDNLQNQGVRVDYLDLYRRQRPEAAPGQWQKISSQSVLPEIVILTSGETLWHWQAVTGAAAQDITPLVISPRLAKLVAEAGLKPAIVSAGTRPDDIIKALSAWRNPAKHGID